MKFLALLIPVSLLALPFPAVAADDTSAPQLAREIWQASGGAEWSKVKEVRFTFEVESDGKVVVSAKHDWKVAEGTDEVTWKDKHAVADLNTPPQDGDAKAAYARWVNDSYWLLAPLKVLDRGVTAKAEGSKEIGGQPCDVLRLSFGTVGLTPTDQYLLYVDPKTKLLRAWDYTPKEGAGMQATWEGFQKFGPLTLATEHHFNGKTIRFTGVEVIADK